MKAYDVAALGVDALQFDKSGAIRQLATSGDIIARRKDGIRSHLSMAVSFVLFKRRRCIA
jgi:hypothetical protein